MTDPESCHELDEIRSETIWLRTLERRRDVRVPELVPARDGSDVTTVRTEGVYGARHVVLFRWIPGRDLGERCPPRLARELGELTARLHTHAETFAPPAAFRIRAADRPFPYSDPSFPTAEPVVLWEDRFASLFPTPTRRLYEHAIDRTQAELDRLFQTGTPRVIHADLHPWNVRVHPRGLYILDFEEIMWGFPALDVAKTFYYLRLRDADGRRRKAYREGYSSVREWPVRDDEQLHTLIGAHGLVLVNFVLASEHPRRRAIAAEFVGRVAGRLPSLPAPDSFG